MGNFQRFERKVSVVTAIGNPPILRKNLMIYLDGSKEVSYPEQGSTWYDISYQNNNGTLISSSFDNGSIVLNGTTSYVVAGRIPFTGTANISVTWGVWVYPTSTSGNIMSMSSQNPQNSWNMPPIAADGQRFRGKIWQNNYMYSAPFELNKWYYVVLVWKYSEIDNERGQFFYVDSELQNSQTGIVYNSSNNNNYIFLGQENPGADNRGMFGGKIGNFHIYGNKALTQKEILHNYNVLKHRYK